jgi:hypothetical protein
MRKTKGSSYGHCVGETERRGDELRNNRWTDGSKRARFMKIYEHNNTQRLRD